MIAIGYSEKSCPSISITPPLPRWGDNSVTFPLCALEIFEAVPMVLWLISIIMSTNLVISFGWNEGRWAITLRLVLLLLGQQQRAQAPQLRNPTHKICKWSRIGNSLKSKNTTQPARTWHQPFLLGRCTPARRIMIWMTSTINQSLSLL